MASLGYALFKEDSGTGEITFGQRGNGFVRGAEFKCAIAPLHADTATTSGTFQQQGKAHTFGGEPCSLKIR
jgi:hypothetical protein